MKVYIAGSSREIERARSAMAAVRVMGHIITHDWTADLDAVGRPDHELSREECQPYAIRDLEAVASAEVFLFLHPVTESTGAWTELGYALRCRNDRYVLGRPPPRPTIIVAGGRRGIFWSLADYNVVDDTAALELLRVRR
jgi:hypothetical protein